MIRAGVFGLLLTAGPAVAEPLPVPPTPPAQVMQSQNAPVPNPDVDGRMPSDEWHPFVALRNFKPPTGPTGLGFTPGSQFRTPEDRKTIQTPGVSFTVPIE